MFKQKCAILVAFLAVVLLFSSVALAADKASKDAILDELSTFIDKNPEILLGVIYSMGDEYSRENKVDEAIALYDKALKILPSNEDLLNRLGSLYNQKADYAKAAEIYKKMTEINPENVWYFNMLSDAYRNAGDNENAGKVWEALTKDSGNADTYIQAANFYSSQGDVDKAIEAVKKATELAPDNMGYLQNLGSFYMNAEKFDEAEAICKKILASSKDQWAKDWANSELINIYQRQDKLKDLALVFEKDLAQAPKELSHYRKLADLYQRSDERDKAIEVYKKAVTAGVADRDVDNRLLDLYEWSSEFDEAVSQIDKMIAAYPDENYLYERRADLLARSGKKDEAKKAWKEFLARTPNDAGVYSRFGDRLNEWGDVDGAVEQYKKAQSLDANNLWYTMRVADILIGKEKFKEATVELKNIIAKTTDDWMKQEAERKISDIDARLKEPVSVSEAVPEVVTPEIKEDVRVEPKPEAEVKKTEEATPEPKSESKKKKKGWFFNR